MQAPPFSGAVIASLITLLCDKLPGDFIIHFGKGDTPKKMQYKFLYQKLYLQNKKPKTIAEKALSIFANWAELQYFPWQQNC